MLKKLFGLLLRNTAQPTMLKTSNQKRRERMRYFLTGIRRPLQEGRGRVQGDREE